mmetsp:Transcript_2157/g.4948  ORF Transcript_2157/g.4948 Transcript_2157/m.4948 type:complete len:226 (+) Transcript_2157:316-993(+)
MSMTMLSQLGGSSSIATSASFLDGELISLLSMITFSATLELIARLFPSELSLLPKLLGSRQKEEESTETCLLIICTLLSLLLSSFSWRKDSTPSLPLITPASLSFTSASLHSLLRIAACSTLLSTAVMSSRCLLSLSTESSPLLSRSDCDLVLSACHVSSSRSSSDPSCFLWKSQFTLLSQDSSACSCAIRISRAILDFFISLLLDSASLIAAEVLILCACLLAS